MDIEFRALLTTQHPYPYPIVDRDSDSDSQNQYTPTLHLGPQAQEAQ